jgi:hypothetical protein
MCGLFAAKSSDEIQTRLETLDSEKVFSETWMRVVLSCGALKIDVLEFWNRTVYSVIRRTIGLKVSDLTYISCLSFEERRQVDVKAPIGLWLQVRGRVVRQAWHQWE